MTSPPPPAITFTGLLSLAGGVHSKLLQFLRPRSGMQLCLFLGDLSRATAFRFLGRARRSHSCSRTSGARASGGGTRGALRRRGRRRRGLREQRPGSGPASLGQAALLHDRRCRVSGAAARVSRSGSGRQESEALPARPAAPSPTLLPSSVLRSAARPARPGLGPRAGGGAVPPGGRELAAPMPRPLSPHMPSLGSPSPGSKFF